MQDRHSPRLEAPTEEQAQVTVTDVRTKREYLLAPLHSTVPRDWFARGMAFLALTLLGAGLVERSKGAATEATVQESHPSSSMPTTNSEQTRPVNVRFEPVDPLWSASQPMTVGDLRFQLFITSSDLSFDFGEVDKLSIAGRSIDVAQALSAPVFVRSMHTCRAMAVLGTASQEGDARIEEQRAGERSEFVQYQIWASGQLRCPLYTLNLGQARTQVRIAAANDKTLTAHQRRLVVATVLAADPETLASDHKLRAALHRALGEVKGLPVDLVRDYSAFDLERKH